MKPAIFITIGTLVLIALIFVGQLDRVSPGPIHSVHAVRAGIDEQSCATCHGDGSNSLADACLSCHEPIADQRTERTGLHGRLDPLAFAACGRCHAEHLGDDASLVTSASFARAGIASLDQYPAFHDRFDLRGAHATVACVDCHPHADAALPPVGEKRFLRTENACADCHGDPHLERHGQSFGTGCQSCHTDGHSFAMQTREWHRPWFPLDDPAHSALSCDSCHVPKSEFAVATLRNPTRRSADRRECVDCHANPHDSNAATAALATAMSIVDARDCALCHAPTRFDAVRFGIDEHTAIGVRLDGAHAAAMVRDGGCRSCHTKLDQKRINNAGRPGVVDRELAQCGSCHDNPHDQSHSEAGASQSLPGGSRTCSACHDTHAFGPATVTTADHHQFGLALSGNHTVLPCSACHSSDAQARRRTVSGSDSGPVAMKSESQCEACHASPHRAFDPHGTVASGTVAAEAPCVSCHQTDHMSFRYPEAQMSPKQHAVVGFPLTTPHDTVDCATCHVGLSSAQANNPARNATFDKRFPGREPHACESCHDTPHTDLATGAFAEARCLDCHRTTGFAPANFSPATHAKTAFPLTGAHLAVPCQSCHTEKLTTGVAAFSGAPTDCVSCHDDPHFGMFGDATCVRCHSTETFVKPQIPFDHGARTRFALDGRHATIDCAQCHVSQVATGGKRRERRRVEPSCRSCHQDPHAGQFKRDCSGCHDPKQPFRVVSFDHSTDARFALDATHAKLDCARCHQPVTRDDGSSVIRYRPLGTACRDCHGGGQR